MTNNKKSFDYASEIWKIADYVRNVISRANYNKVVLPFALLRRLECALEPTREDVSNAVEKHEHEWGLEHDNYCSYSKKSFYNVTNFRLNTLGAVNTLEALKGYIAGFSPNAREILNRFKMEETMSTLHEKEMLYEVCMRFSRFDLSPENVSDREMSNIYEHLIERYGEEIAEDAEDFMTPKDVVRLAVSMIFANDEELMNSDDGTVRTLYDPTAGTGGFILDALDQLDEWHNEKMMVAPALIVPYGQEITDESWAMCKANLLLRNIANDENDIYDQIKDLSSHIMLGDTLANDMFEDMKFNYILSNPPYGKKWETSEEAVKKEAQKGFRGRFGAGLPSITDGSMLFLQHVVSKFEDIEHGGGKAGIVLSGSPLFTGDAGTGPSNIRRWLFEKDYIDCIVKLPEQIFFRTGISTYLWILTNKKEDNRKGMIQLIDASSMKTQMRKSLGNKRYEISHKQMETITNKYVNGIVDETSVIVPYKEFMFRQISTVRPLRMKIKIDKTKINELVDSYPKLSDQNKTIFKEELKKNADEFKEYSWVEDFVTDTRKLMNKASKEITPDQMRKGIYTTFGIKDSSYEASKNKKGEIVFDSELNDKENIPFGIDFAEYMEKEVLPFAEDAVIDQSVLDKGTLQDGKTGVVGTSISFNKYFYHYEEPRNPEDIAKEIFKLEKELEGFMEEFLK